MIEIDRSRWLRIRFGDIAQSVTDRVDDPSAAGVDRYVGLEHLDAGSLTINRWGSPEDVAAMKLRFEPGDVVFARRRAYQRKLGQADFKGIASAHSLVLRACPGNVLPEFLPVFLSSDAFMDRAIQISVGSLSPTVNWKTLAVQEFDLPPLDEQNRIAELLWAVERVRLAREREAEKASALELTLLKSELDRADIPRVRLDEIVKVQRGLSYRSEDYAEHGDGRPFLTLKSVTRAGHYAEGSLKYLRLEDPGSYVVKPGDLFIANTDLTPGRLLVGAPFFYTGEQASEKPVFSMDLSRLIPIRPEVSTEYLHLALRTPAARAFMRANTGGSTVGHLHLKAVGGFMVAWPDEPARRSLIETMRAVVRAGTTSRRAAGDSHRVGQAVSRVLWELR